MIMPRGKMPEVELEWRVPDIWNAFERNRSRAYSVAYTALVALNVWRQGMDLLKQGETAVSTPFEIPTSGQQIGVGFWGAGRGFLTHHVIIEDGVCTNYQIITPSTTNASPRDHWDNPGMYETAVLNTPILETSNRDDYQGIDILRAIRSFDPCMPCTTHVHTDDRMITREVNTCACGLEH
jgi:hydrogenase large subunit